jgi:hypothetical protein
LVLGGFGAFNASWSKSFLASLFYKKATAFFPLRAGFAGAKI